MNRVLKIGILGSGRGTNFEAIANAIDEHRLHAEIGIVLSDIESAPVLEKARQRGIPSRYLHPGPFKTKLSPEAEKAYLESLQEKGIELVVLAGFMRILKSPFLETYPGKIMNIHPSLLPAFRGLEAWTQALHSGVKVTGCTVHFLDEGMDTGSIILQEAVTVLGSDTPETLHARIQQREHVLYPRAIQLFAEGRLKIEDRKVTILKEEQV